MYYRVYDEETLTHVWRVGPIPCAVPPTGSNVPYLNSLGDTAVDFDIAPPRVISSNNDTHNISTLTTVISYVTDLSKLLRAKIFSII